MFAIVQALSVVLAMQADSNFTAHEWGTFTTVVDADGAPLDWFRPHLTEPLPEFVHRTEFLKQRSDFPVRMETPVIYFHTPAPLVVDVAVSFPDGLITETYPLGKSTWDEERKVRSTWWRSLRIDPFAEPAFPRELGGDHYYAARAVAAAPVALDLGDLGVERERFVFYRGVGDFEVPLRVTQDGDRLRIVNEGAASLNHAFVFEGEGSRRSLRALGELRPGAVVVFDRYLEGPDARIDLSVLEDALVAEGLFRDEAAAMIETWRGSWFEDGLRVLVTLPREAIDAWLPLSIIPAPQRVERVFVSRHDIVTPALREEIVTFGRELEAGRVGASDAERARSRFGRVGYGVLMREALALEASDPARCWKQRELASRFVSGE